MKDDLMLDRMNLSQLIARGICQQSVAKAPPEPLVCVYYQLGFVLFDGVLTVATLNGHGQWVVQSDIERRRQQLKRSARRRRARRKRAA